MRKQPSDVKAVAAKSALLFAFENWDAPGEVGAPQPAVIGGSLLEKTRSEVIQAATPGQPLMSGARRFKVHVVNAGLR